MTTPKVDSIGLVADYSEQGDWALDAALEIARGRNARLNVFSFVESPFEVAPGVSPAQLPPPRVDSDTLIRLDRELRERWDDRLGDFVEVGFRVCESVRHNLELRRCLKRREYQLLVIPYLARGVSFGNMPIEEFAYRFSAPVMLVGPERPDQRHLNPSARVLVTSVGVIQGTWTNVPEPAVLQRARVI
jgi:hypothetical protein